MGTIRPGRPEKYSPATANGTIPPAEPGLYRIRSRTTGKVEYIGETGNIYRRLLEHTRNGKFDLDSHEIEWKCADSTSTSVTRREIEKIWISRHNPTLNRNIGGGGRLTQQPSSDSVVEEAPAYMRESKSDWRRAGHDLTLRLRETVGTVGNEIKEELIARVKEGLQGWFEEQMDRFIERSTRRIRNMVFPPKPPPDIRRIIEEAPSDAIVEIAYRDDLLPLLDTILSYTPKVQLQEGWASATIMGRPVRVILSPSMCAELLGYYDEARRLRQLEECAPDSKSQENR